MAHGEERRAKSETAKETHAKDSEILNIVLGIGIGFEKTFRQSRAISIPKNLCMQKLWDKEIWI